MPPVLHVREEFTDEGAVAWSFPPIFTDNWTLRSALENLLEEHGVTLRYVPNAPDGDA